MHFPVCQLRVDVRSHVIAHLKTMQDPSHKAALTYSSPVYQQLRGLHVIPCPLGCGAVYDGGRTGSSRHYDAHVEKRSCKRSETSGPWCATTVTSVQSASREHMAASSTTVELVSAFNAITHCLLHSGFMRDHILHGRVNTLIGIPLLALDLIISCEGCHAQGQQPFRGLTGCSNGRRDDFPLPRALST